MAIHLLAAAAAAPKLIMDPFNHFICLPSRAQSKSSLLPFCHFFAFVLFPPPPPPAPTHCLTPSPSRISYLAHGEGGGGLCVYVDVDSRGRSAWSLQGVTGEARTWGGQVLIDTEHPPSGLNKALSLSHPQARWAGGGHLWESSQVSLLANGEGGSCSDVTPPLSSYE